MVLEERKSTIVLEVDVDETIESVKKKIAHLQGIPLSHQRIIHQGRQLKDDKSLQDYDIMEQDLTLFLVCAAQHKMKYWTIEEEYCR